jgi:hypothetical protein
LVLVVPLMLTGGLATSRTFFGVQQVAAVCAPVRRSTTAQAITSPTNPTYPHDHSRSWSSSVSRGSTSVG